MTLSGGSDAGRKGRRLALLAAGYASLGVAGLGVALPLLPTTPFLLLALWAFTRSSPALAERLRRGRRFGPALRDWQEGGAISRKAKQHALMLMALGWIWLALAVREPLALTAATACMAGAAAFILTRPSGEPRRERVLRGRMTKPSEGGTMGCGQRQAGAR